jgi:pantothenate kinase
VNQPPNQAGDARADRPARPRPSQTPAQARGHAQASGPNRPAGQPPDRRPATIGSLAELLDRARALVAATPPGRPAVIGVSGEPGAGKSTLAEHLETRLGAELGAVRVPLDGFHLSDAVLAALGRGDRKGAMDTFDGWGYAALLARLRAGAGHTVYAPGFERSLEQPLAGAIAVAPGTRLVITEGNYLLAPDPPWPEARRLIDEVWHVELDPASRRRRLVERHIRFGKTPAEAAAWVDRVDGANAAQVAAWRLSADWLVGIGQLDLPRGRD